MMTKFCRLSRHLAVAVVFTGMGLFATPSNADKASNTLRWASRFPIDVIDPYANTSREATLINSQLVWDTLIWRDPENGEYKPLLATEWKWVDDTTLEFKLRSDVRWHNGQPLTVDDAVYTLNRISSPSAKIGIPNNVKWIQGAEKTGDATFLLRLKQPFPAALEYVASLLPILPANLYENDPVTPAFQRAVGTGPYRVVAFSPGSSIDLELNDQYFQGSPKGRPTIRHISYRTIPEASTQIAELLSGGVDWIWNVPADQATAIERRGNVSVVSGETMRLSLITLNIRDKEGTNPLKDPKVRQAIAHAIDRDRLVKSLVGKGSEVPRAGCYRQQFGCPQDVKQYPYDPELSKKLLAEAGVASGLTLDLQATRSRDWTAAVAGYLTKVGIKTNVNFLTYPAAQERLAQNKSELYLLDHGWFSINDASAALDPFFSGDHFDAVQDKMLLEFRQAASSTTDATRRQELLGKAFARIAEEVYLIPMWTHPNIHAFSKELDFNPYPDENPRFYLAKWK